MEYKNVPLQEVTTKINSGATPKGGKSAYLKDGDYSLIRSQNVYNNRLERENLAFIDESQAYKLKNATLEKDDILINITGDSVARCTIVENGILPARVNQHVMIIRCDQKLLKPYYLLAFLTSRKIQKKLISRASSGATRAALTKKDLQELKIPIVSMPSQDFISKLLRDINNKIKTNNIVISNLEELSQTLFKRWFVDFEFPDENGSPYKSNGGKFKESTVGNIPLDWEASVFNNFIEESIAGDWGKATPQKNYNSKVTIIRGADIPQLKKGKPGAPPSRYILEKNKDKKQIQNGDIVIEISGGSPTQSTGRTLYINQNILDRFQTPVLSTNFCRILRPKSIEYGQWLELYLQYLYEKDVFFNFENGTTGIKNFDYKAILTKFNIASPTNDIIRKFHYEISYLRDHIQNLGSENQKLSELRDILLPKLMSGEIELPDNLEVTEDVELLQRR